MKISEVMELTGLTKKAINYYEDEGLISPCVNPENNYREYSLNDIEKLMQIAVLRQFDVPIKEIRDMQAKPLYLKQKLEQHLLKLDEEAKRLEKSKNILKMCLQNLNDGTLKVLTNQLSLLNKALLMEEQQKEGFMKRQLQRVFPGNFGKMLTMHFSPFLTEAIDTPLKEQAWLSIVQFLDEVENIEYPDEFKELYEKVDDEFLKKYEDFINDNVKKWLDFKDEDVVKERESLIKNIDKINQNNEMKDEFKKFTALSGCIKDLMNNIGYYDRFVNNLKILSEKYSLYTQKTTEFYKSFNVRMDDEGKLVVDDSAN